MKCTECNGRGHFLLPLSTPTCDVCGGTGEVAATLRKQTRADSDATETIVTNGTENLRRLVDETPASLTSRARFASEPFPDAHLPQGKVLSDSVMSHAQRAMRKHLRRQEQLAAWCVAEAILGKGNATAPAVLDTGPHLQGPCVLVPLGGTCSEVLRLEDVQRRVSVCWRRGDAPGEPLEVCGYSVQVPDPDRPGLHLTETRPVPVAARVDSDVEAPG